MATIRVKFKKYDLLKFIGHLDLMRLLKRAFIRANIDVKYSQGFNPQPKLSFATALALGISSKGEYFDLEMEKILEPSEFILKLNSILPDGIEILDAKYVNGKTRIMSQIKWSSYIIEVFFKNKITLEEVNSKINNILSKKEIIIYKEKKKGKRIVKREVNIRDLIKKVDIISKNNDSIIIKTMLKTGSYGNLKPEVIIDLLIKEGLDIDTEQTNIERLELYIEDNGNIVTPI